jgi:5-methylcytosine-specific restriction endonuclease McrA
MKLCGKGCGSKIPDNARCCDNCAAERGIPVDIASHTSGYTDELDTLRKGTRWQQRRKKVLINDPMCARCRVAVAEIVDHIVPAAVAVVQAQLSKKWPFDKYVGYYLITNLQGLCRSCHGVKTLEDKAHVGPWPDVVEKEAAAPKKVLSF